MKKSILIVAVLMAVLFSSVQHQPQVEESAPPVYEVSEREVAVIEVSMPVETVTIASIKEPEVSKVEQDLIDHMLGQGVEEDKAKFYTSLIMEYTSDPDLEYPVDPYTVVAMIEGESHYSETLVGRDDDVGLMQIRIPAQKTVGIEGDRKDPAINIAIGVKYLAYCQKQFGEDLGLTAYNQGEGNVRKGTYSNRYYNYIHKILDTIAR